MSIVNRIEDNSRQLIYAQYDCMIIIVGVARTATSL